MRFVAVLGFTFVLSGFVAAQPEKSTPLLSAKDLADGWLLLFDGETPYGWSSAREESKDRRALELKVEDGVLILGALKNKGMQQAFAPACVDNFELNLEYQVHTRGEVKANLLIYRGDQVASKHEFNRTDNPMQQWQGKRIKLSHGAAIN